VSSDSKNKTWDLKHVDSSAASFYEATGENCYGETVCFLCCGFWCWYLLGSAKIISFYGGDYNLRVRR
jgi:hypothetical protein